MPMQDSAGCWAGNRGTSDSPALLREIGLHPDYEAEYEDFLRRGMDKKDGIRQIQRIRHENGTWVWRQVRTVRLFYPDHPLPLMMEISTDISEMIEKGKKLRESQRASPGGF